jgi:hypothetical protein
VRELKLRRYPGASLCHLVDGSTRGHRRKSLNVGEYGDLRMIHTPSHKLVCRYPAGPHELFLLPQAIPSRFGEATNVYDVPKYESVRAHLAAAIDTFYSRHEDPAKSGLRVKQLRRHNNGAEAWRDGLREARGLQIY